MNPKTREQIQSSHLTDKSSVLYQNQVLKSVPETKQTSRMCFLLLSPFKHEPKQLQRILSDVRSYKLQSIRVSVSQFTDRDEVHVSIPPAEGGVAGKSCRKPTEVERGQSRPGEQRSPEEDGVKTRLVFPN